jgi:hypothetical protein
VNEPRIIQADLNDTQHRAAVLEMIRAYACDPLRKRYWQELLPL